jgi:sirohydrochlorin cobaltochelatase
VDRIHEQADTWAAEHPDAVVRHGAHLGPDARVAQLVLERHREAIEGEARMNCDCCVYRIAIPGYEEQVGLPTPLHAHPHSHGHDHPHNGGVPVHEHTGGGEHIG